MTDTCALATDGAPYCWGALWGPSPRPVATAERFETLSMDSRTTCALTAEGKAFCWGRNEDGQFGNGAFDDFEPRPYHREPVPVETERRFSRIEVGGSHVCALDRDTEEAYCWGSDSIGQLGDGSPPGPDPDVERKLAPTRVLLSRRLIDLSVNGQSSCAVTSGHEAYCWGYRTGNASAPISEIPVLVGD